MGLPDQSATSRRPQAKVVRIANTLHLEQFYASEALLPEIQANPRLRVVSGWEPMGFDGQGNLAPDRF